MTATIEQAATAPAGELELAVDALETLRARAAAEEAKRDAARLGIEQIEVSAGADLLDSDDPDAGERLALRLGTLRAAVELHGRAAAEAHARATAAAASALRVEAALLEPDLEVARAELSKFDAKTDSLVRALEKHTACRVKVVDPNALASDAIRDGHAQVVEYVTPHRWPLLEAVEALEVRQGVARALAEVVEGSRSVQDAHAQFMPTVHDPFRPTAGWASMPALVRDGVVVVDGLWVAPLELSSPASD